MSRSRLSFGLREPTCLHSRLRCFSRNAEFPKMCSKKRMYPENFQRKDWLLISIAFIATFFAGCKTPGPPHKPHDAKQWEKDIQAFEAADRTNPPPQNAILFIGSSSIKRWATLTENFAGYTVINRGFGGSHLSDSVAFVDRIVVPYKPKIVLIYAGDNDIAFGKSPEEVFGDFKKFVKKIHATLPETKVDFISIKPSPAREKYLEQIKKTNRMVKEFASKQKRVGYIDVFTPMLSGEGRPRPELFVKDGLHPNKECYEMWAAIIKPALNENQKR